MGQAYYKWGKRDGLEVYFLGRSNMTCCIELARVARIKGKGREDDSHVSGSVVPLVGRDLYLHILKLFNYFIFLLCQ